MDTDLIKTVSEDLDYLSEEWIQDIDDTSLRRASPVLRSLLIDNQLMRVADMFNEEIKITAPFISKYDHYLNDPSIVFYQSGGAKYKGIEVQFLKQLNRAKLPEEIKADYEREKSLIGQVYLVKLSLFMKQISFMINGVKINREEVVKYIANKKGGVHYDDTRKTNSSGSKGELERKYLLLDDVYNSRFTVDKNAVYYELLSIGQRLIESNDVQRIRQILMNAR